MMPRSFILLALICLALTACQPAAVDALPPTATTVRVVPSTLVPTADRRAHTVPTIVPTVTAPAAQVECQDAEGQPLTRHTVTANINFEERALVAFQNVRYANRTGGSLENIMLVVDANQWPGAFALQKVTMGSDALEVTYELTGRRLSIELPQPLDADCALSLDLAFRLDVPQVGNGVSAFKGYLGHTPRQLNLGNWLPVVAPFAGGEWISPEAVIVGEQTVLEVADWDVTVNVSGASDGLIVAGPGDVTQAGERTWRFALNDSRDFTLSLSDVFSVSSHETANGVTVELYSFGDALVPAENGGVIDAAQYALEVGVESLEFFTERFGPYGRRRLVVVQGDFPDGMEFSGMVFVGGDWFRRFAGQPTSYLMLITAHEVAHQWWYAQVGSNQAVDPWLDEALATYSEYLYIEEHYPDLTEWWWGFRVNNFSPEGFVDSTVYQFTSIREYINAVYLLGARMLHDLRRDLGDEAFFDLLRRYAEMGTNRLVSPELFWSLFTGEQLEATLATRQEYLRQPGLSGS